MMPFVLANTAHGTMIVPLNDHNTNEAGQTYGVGAQIFHRWAYEPGEVEMLKDLLRLRRKHHGDGVMFLDCGANIGVFTVECAALMGGTPAEPGWGIVVGIEAQERLFYALAGNVNINNLMNARVMWGAVSDRTGRIDTAEPDYSRPGSFGSLELRERLDGRTEDIGQPLDRKSGVRVPAFPIDMLGITRLDVLKIDVEGMEIEAIRGAAATIERCRPIILVERIKVDEAELQATLKTLRYKTAPRGLNLLAVPNEVSYLDWDLMTANAKDTFADEVIQKANQVGESGNAIGAMIILDESGLLEDEHPLHWLALLNYGTLEMQVNHFMESLRTYQLVIDHGGPELRDRAIFGRGFARLRLGDLKGGFEDFEHRKRWSRPKVITDLPEWKGEDIGGKTLLVVGEMGFGDNIMFSRFFGHLVNARGANVMVTVQPTLEPLMACLPNIQVYGKHSPPFDYWVDMMSLAHRYGIDAGNIPEPTKFHLPPERVAKWRGARNRHAPSAGCLHVGLCWSGSRESQYDKHRNIPLEMLSPLFEIDAVYFHSLQLDVRATDAEAFANFPVSDLAPNLADFLETACAVKNLDLVITVDTAIAHLAASLGVPTWVMLSSYRTYWLWQIGKRDCPWYPAAQSYQQRVDGEWGPVVEEIAADIRYLMGKRLLAAK